jgi:hypothetical protein
VRETKSCGGVRFWSAASIAALGLFCWSGLPRKNKKSKAAMLAALQKPDATPVVNS